MSSSGLRWLAAIAALSRVAWAQENASIRFEPRDYGPRLASWQTLLAAFAVSALLYLFWKLLSWRSAQTAPNPALRIWFPTTMIGLAWTVGLAEAHYHPSDNSLSGLVLELALSGLVIVNLPVLMLVGALAACLRSDSGWGLAILATLLGWFSWYWIARLLEWRAARRRPIRLQIE